jgi:hypothetical protein
MRSPTNASYETIATKCPTVAGLAMIEPCRTGVRLRESTRPNMTLIVAGTRLPAIGALSSIAVAREKMNNPESSK